VTTPWLILIGIVSLTVSGIAVEAYVKRGKRRPLSTIHERSRPKIELGMEATDMSVANAILKRNDALARKTGQGGRHVTWTETNAIGPELIPEDETYASRYIGTHREKH
jgi:hypothetical protein